MTAEEFLEATRKRSDADFKAVSTLLDWCREQGLEIRGGAGRKNGTLYVHVGADTLCCFENSRRGEGYIYLYFERMGPAFETIAARKELCDKFNVIKDVDLSAEKRYPGLGIYRLRTEADVRTIRDAFAWMLERMRS